MTPLQCRCPCGSTQTRKASSIFESETTEGTSTYRGRTVRHKSSSQLAQRLAPPVNPYQSKFHQLGFLLMWTFSLLLVGGFITSNRLIERFYQAMTDTMGILPPIIIFLLAGYGCFRLWQLMLSGSYARYREEYQQWNRLYYCYSCGSILKV